MHLIDKFCGDTSQWFVVIPDVKRDKGVFAKSQIHEKMVNTPHHFFCGFDAFLDKLFVLICDATRIRMIDEIKMRVIVVNGQLPDESQEFFVNVFVCIFQCVAALNWLVITSLKQSHDLDAIIQVGLIAKVF